MKFLESQRTTITKDVGAAVEGSKQLKALYKAVAVEGETVVGAEAEAEATGAPMDRSSMECTSKTSNKAFTKERCNIWVLKKTPTSPRSTQRPTKIYSDE